MNETEATPGMHYCATNAYHWQKADTIAKARNQLRRRTQDGFIRKVKVGCNVYSVPGPVSTEYGMIEHRPDIDGYKLVLDLEVN